MSLFQVKELKLRPYSYSFLSMVEVKASDEISSSLIIAKSTILQLDSLNEDHFMNKDFMSSNFLLHQPEVVVVWPRGSIKSSSSHIWVQTKLLELPRNPPIQRKTSVSLFGDCWHTFFSWLLSHFHFLKRQNATRSVCEKKTITQPASVFWSRWSRVENIDV